MSALQYDEGRSRRSCGTRFDCAVICPVPFSCSVNFPFLRHRSKKVLFSPPQCLPLKDRRGNNARVLFFLSGPKDLELSFPVNQSSKLIKTAQCRSFSAVTLLLFFILASLRRPRPKLTPVSKNRVLHFLSSFPAPGLAFPFSFYPSPSLNSYLSLMVREMSLFFLNRG